MRFLGVLLPLLLATPALAQPAPADTPIQTPGPSGPLAGSLRRAAVPSAPVVLIIPGSGPTDRDGNSPMGILAAPYRLLAEGLAARGITTVRVDKRGMFGSAAAVPDADAVTVAEYGRDIRNWVAAIRRETGAAASGCWATARAG